MNKFESKRRYLIAMYFVSINNKQSNYYAILELLEDLLKQVYIERKIIEPIEIFGKDSNEYMAFLEGCH